MPAESPTKDADQAAQTAKGAVQATKSAVQTVKAVATIAKAGSGPAGWIMLAKQYGGQIKEAAAKLRKAIAIAAAAALTALLLLLLWLMQKFLGVVAGLAFGAVSGAPLLLVPGVGPILYGGWVGFWGVRGYLDPAGTIHLATHPWEAVTKPLGYVKDQFFSGGSTVKGGVESVASGTAHGVGSLLGTTANFFTGAASAAWNGITSAPGVPSWLGLAVFSMEKNSF